VKAAAKTHSQSEQDVYSQATERTTVMISNLPNRLKESAIVEQLELLGLENRFDYLYMPRDYKTMANMGYAFVNFMRDSDAEVCIRRLAGTQFRGSMSKKLLDVSHAAKQGLVANLVSMKHTNWRNMKHMPMVLVNGELRHMVPSDAIMALISAKTENCFAPIKYS
jgi:RNA recognition motif-containing protein